MADDRFSVRAHVSAMDHADVVQQAMEAWLGEVEVERSAYASHAGPTMLTLSVDLRRKSDLRKAWAGIDEAALNTLLVEVNDRLDDEGGLHFRIWGRLCVFSCRDLELGSLKIRVFPWESRDNIFGDCGENSGTCSS